MREGIFRKFEYVKLEEDDSPFLKSSEIFIQRLEFVQFPPHNLPSTVAILWGPRPLVKIENTFTVAASQDQ